MGNLPLPCHFDILSFYHFSNMLEKHGGNMDTSFFGRNYLHLHLYFYFYLYLYLYM